MPSVMHRPRRRALFVGFVTAVGGLAVAATVGGPAQADNPDPIVPLAIEASSVLSGLRFIEGIDAVEREQVIATLNGGYDAPFPAVDYVPDVRIGWFRATYEQRVDDIATLVGERLGADPAAFRSEWLATSDQRMLTLFAGLEQLGKPYVWASTGPESFDCSGFTRHAWAATGVELDHYSLSQANVGEPVDPADVQVGDLVHSPGHIMMALGVDDWVIESSGGGVQLDDWGARADGWTDPLVARTVSWRIADPPGLRRGPDAPVEPDLPSGVIERPPTSDPTPVTSPVPPTTGPGELRPPVAPVDSPPPASPDDSAELTASSAPTASSQLSENFVGG
jgi:hypothetical protein